MTDIKNKIEKIVGQNLNKVLEIRRHIHQHPELSFKEFETSAYIKSILDELEISYTDNWVKTGIVAEVEGDQPGPTIALRADIDALPIDEKTDLPFKSDNKGIMHACGHDIHASSLIGVLTVINELKSDFAGKVIFIFQPGEEEIPGGASLMIKEGLLEKFKPKSIVAQHTFPDLPAGKVGFFPGTYMASNDELHVTVKGKGGHGAMPHKTVDTVLMSAHLITSLQQVISRTKDPFTPAVLTFGRIEGLGATNVIPDEVHLQGTFRTMDEAYREKAHERMLSIANGIAEGMGGSIDFEIRRGYPNVHNDVDLTEKCMSWAREFLGDENVVNLEQRMTSEDFAFYSQEIPGCFYRLGTGFENRENFGLHHPKYEVNEDAIRTGIELMSYLTIKQLEQ